MNGSTKIIFSFVLGAAAGAAVAWKLLEKKFENRFLEEVEVEKEAYEKRLKAINVAFGGDKSSTVNDCMVAKKMAAELGYTGEEETDMDKPRIIHPDKYAQIDEYDIQSLIYYEGDRVLTDDYNHPVENIKDMVGLDFAEHFGEYEEDSVFIQNDRYKTYYEICRSLDNFSEIAEVDE